MELGKVVSTVYRIDRYNDKESMLNNLGARPESAIVTKHIVISFISNLLYYFLFIYLL